MKHEVCNATEIKKMIVFQTKLMKSRFYKHCDFHACI